MDDSQTLLVRELARELLTELEVTATRMQMDKEFEAFKYMTLWYYGLAAVMLILTCLCLFRHGLFVVVFTCQARGWRKSAHGASADYRKRAPWPRITDQAETADKDTDNCGICGGSSETSSPNKQKPKKEILCIADKGTANIDGTQKELVMPTAGVQHPTETPDTYSHMVSCYTHLLNTMGTATFRGDASGHHFLSSRAGSSDSGEAGSGSDGDSSVPDDNNIESESESLLDPVEESVKPKRVAVPPAPIPTGQNDIEMELPTEVDPTSPSQHPMNQAMALPNEYYGVSGRVNVEVADSSHMEKTGPEDKPPTKRADHPLQGQSEVKKLSGQTQLAVVTSVQGGLSHAQGRRVGSSDTSPSQTDTASDCSNNIELGGLSDHVGEPPPPIPFEFHEDTQDMVSIENEGIEISNEGQPLQFGAAVHMAPQDRHLPPLRHPTQDSEEGRSRPSQLMPPRER